MYWTEFGASVFHANLDGSGVAAFTPATPCSTAIRRWSTGRCPRPHRRRPTRRRARRPPPTRQP
ncbi:MAG: hypothetical protein HZY76_03410 [Anaerolineae bacterium]|nr:MAG: hypothetical protein HZY76_03410 [Anaerolineae bacterium]